MMNEIRFTENKIAQQTRINRVVKRYTAKLQNKLVQLCGKPALEEFINEIESQGTLNDIFPEDDEEFSIAKLRKDLKQMKSN